MPRVWAARLTPKGPKGLSCEPASVQLIRTVIIVSDTEPGARSRLRCLLRRLWTLQANSLANTSRCARQLILEVFVGGKHARENPLRRHADGRHHARGQSQRLEGRLMLKSSL
jgi:hypothetical protein